MEKHELSKFEFEIIETALKALLQSNLDPVTADKGHRFAQYVPGRLYRLARSL